MPKTDQRIFRFSRLTNYSHVAIDWLGSVSSLLVHTIIFAGSFVLIFFGFDANKVLLVVTTMVSLEAIYMAIFIQMAVNRNTQSLNEVEENIDEIQEDVDEIQKDVDEIQEDVDEIQKDVDEIQEDVEEIQKDEEAEAAQQKERQNVSNKDLLNKIETQLHTMLTEIEELKKARN
jgi:biopolymer transport protein ExbB/TolQ